MRRFDIINQRLVLVQGPIPSRARVNEWTAAVPIRARRVRRVHVILAQHGRRDNGRRLPREIARALAAAPLGARRERRGEGEVAFAEQQQRAEREVVRRRRTVGRCAVDDRAGGR